MVFDVLPSLGLPVIFDRQYCWTEGKKARDTALLYVDYVTGYVQKTITDETIFPTKCGQQFPITFQATVKRIHKYMLHVMAHIYHVHYKELLALHLNGHMNTLSTHFMVFNNKFDLLEENDYEMLNDLLATLINELPDHQHNDESQDTR